MREMLEMANRYSLNKMQDPGFFIMVPDGVLLHIAEERSGEGRIMGYLSDRRESNHGRIAFMEIQTIRTEHRFRPFPKRLSDLLVLYLNADDSWSCPHLFTTLTISLALLLTLLGLV
jgi:hypothetical protein